jgi:hypothetical protein
MNHRWNEGRATAILVCLWATSCHRDATSTESSPKSIATAGVAVPNLPDATTTSPSPSEELGLVNRWSEALDRHDVAALSSLYGEKVRYYGRETSRRNVLDAKRAALGPKSTFHQKIIGTIDVHPASDAKEATFTKRSGGSGKTSDVVAKLLLRREPGGVLVIVEETDAPSEARRAAHSRDQCESAAAKVANDLPAVKKAVADANKAADESSDRAHFGGIGPIDDDDGGFSVGFGIHTKERYEGQVWYSVDRAGHLEVTVLGEDQKIPAAALHGVEAACKP